MELVSRDETHRDGFGRNSADHPRIQRRYPVPTFPDPIRSFDRETASGTNLTKPIFAINDRALNYGFMI